MQHAVPRQAPFRPPGAVADGPEGRFYGVAGPNALPVLRREVIEGHHFVAVFLQADGGLRVFWLIHFHEQIEGLFSFCLPDVVQ